MEVKERERQVEGDTLISSFCSRSRSHLQNLSRALERGARAAPARLHEFNAPGYRLPLRGHNNKHKLWREYSTILKASCSGSWEPKVIVYIG